MHVSDFIGPGDLVPDMIASEKSAVLEELAAALASRHTLNSQEVFRVFWERERLASTGIGEGVAIPHGKLGQASRLCGILARSRQGIEFESIDGSPAHLFFALVAPENSTGLHLKALARISRLLKDSLLRQRLLEASDSEEMYRILVEEDGKY